MRANVNWVLYVMRREQKVTVETFSGERNAAQSSGFPVPPIAVGIAGVELRTFRCVGTRDMMVRITYYAV